VDLAGTSGVRIQVVGVSAHASTPDQGQNALWPLASIARRLNVDGSGARSILDVIAEVFDGDHHGQRLGVFYEHAFMGKLLVAPTRLRMEQGWVTLEVNMRRPGGRTPEQFKQSLGEAATALKSRFGAGIEPVQKQYVGSPHEVDHNSALVRELLRTYHEVTGLPAFAASMPGGTYARLFDGAVDFGPGFPGKPYTGHGADEYMEIDSLVLTAEMIVEACLRLAM